MTTTLPTQDRWKQLRSYYEGFWATWILHVGRELNILQKLVEQPGLNPEQLAESLGYETTYVEVWCRAAHIYEYIESVDGMGWRIADGWDGLLFDTGAWASTYVQLSNRVYETLDAVFRGRALPETSLNLRLYLASGLRASYRWLWLQWAAQRAEIHERLNQSKRLIEFGCGFGLGLEVLREHYPHLELTGLEWDYDCALEAERATRAVVVVGPPEECTYQERFDVALFHRCLALCEDPQVALTRAVEALRPGGLLFIVSESELPQECTPEQRQTLRLRLGERFFFQMFHSPAALRNLSLNDFEGWMTAHNLRRLYREDLPIGGSPLLVMEKLAS